MIVTLRRAYLYGAAFASLLFLVDGTVGLITNVLQLSFEGWAGPPIALGTGYARSVRDVAVWETAIGLVGWTVHWWLSNWWVRKGGPASIEERSSAIRKLYLYLVILFGALFTVRAVDELIAYYPKIGTGEITATNIMAGQVVNSLANLVVFVAFWLYHLAVLREDRALAPEVGAGTVIRRVYVYALNVLLGVHLAAAALQLIGQLGAEANPGTGSLPGVPVGSVVPMISAILVWIGIRYLDGTGIPRWLLHADESAPGRLTRTRQLVALLLSFAAMILTAPQIGLTLSLLLRAGLDPAALTINGAKVVGELAPRVLQIGFFGAIWFSQARLLWRDSRMGPVSSRAWQLYVYGACFLGLVQLWLGLPNALADGALLRDDAAADLFAPGYLVEQLTRWAGQGLTGLAIWAGHWWLAQRSTTSLSSVRRFYLLGVVPMSAVVLVATVLSTQAMLASTELEGAGRAVELQRIEYASLFVGLVIFLYHLFVLVYDIRRQQRVVKLVGSAGAATDATESLTPSDLARARRDPLGGHALLYFLTMPSWTAVQQATRQLQDDGYQVQIDQGRSDSEWVICARGEVAPTNEALGRTCDALDRLAVGVGGTYDGWDVQLNPGARERTGV